MDEQIVADRIVKDPTILVGKPVVKGTRIAVEVVLDYLARNPNFEDLFVDYPRLTMEDVKACLAVAQLPSDEGTSATRTLLQAVVGEGPVPSRSDGRVCCFGRTAPRTAGGRGALWASLPYTQQAVRRMLTAWHLRPAGHPRTIHHLDITHEGRAKR